MAPQAQGVPGETQRKNWLQSYTTYGMFCTGLISLLLTWQYSSGHTLQKKKVMDYISTMELPSHWDDLANNKHVSSQCAELKHTCQSHKHVSWNTWINTYCMIKDERVTYFDMDDKLLWSSSTYFLYWWCVISWLWIVFAFSHFNCRTDLIILEQWSSNVLNRAPPLSGSEHISTTSPTTSHQFWEKLQKKKKPQHTHECVFAILKHHSTSYFPSRPTPDLATQDCSLDRMKMFIG